VLASPLSALSNISRRGEAVRIVDGIVSVIDGLKPGITASLRYDSPGFDTSVQLGGNSVTIFYGNGSWSRDVLWQLSVTALAAGKTYAVRLQGMVVEVSPIVRS
jgi:hypothetical protein